MKMELNAKWMQPVRLIGQAHPAFPRTSVVPSLEVTTYPLAPKKRRLFIDDPTYPPLVTAVAEGSVAVDSHLRPVPVGVRVCLFGELADLKTERWAL